MTDVHERVSANGKTVSIKIGRPWANGESTGVDPARDRVLRDRIPRFSTLSTCIRAGLYGVDAPDVKHMIERNLAVDCERAFAQASLTSKETSV